MGADFWSTASGLLISTGIGILIGLEREFAQRGESESFAGIRTFTLASMCGFLSTVVAKESVLWFLPASFLGLSALVAVAHLVLAQRGASGGTTEISVLMTYTLGALAALGEGQLAVTTAVFVTVLLSLKLEFQAFVGKLSVDDVRAILKFVVLTVLIFPFLPVGPIDPWGILVPREIWFVVVLVLSVSFLGYMFMKFWSVQHGILATALLGGLASSTAVTWVLARQSRTDPQNGYAYGTAVVLANSIMFLRIIILSYLFYPPLALHLALPLGLIAVAALVLGLTLYQRVRGVDRTLPAELLGNPLNIVDAIKYGVMYSAIVVCATIARSYFGSAGIYLASGLSGLYDVDAITILMAKSGQAGSTTDTMVNAVIIAAGTNNLVKYGMAVTRGGPSFRRVCHLGFGLIFFMSLVSVAFLR